MNIVMTTLSALSQAIITPSYILLVVIMAAVFYRKNRKTALMQKMIIGESLESPFVLTISEIVLGVIGGAIGSVILSYFGIVFKDDSAIFILFLISIFLMILGSRFVCFSYSGAILGFISLILRLAALNGIDISEVKYLEVDVTMLMALVAVLHIIEGLLVMIDGTSGAIPVFTSRGNKIVGGFAFKRYWLLPIAMLFMANGSQLTSGPQYLAGDFWNTSITILKNSALIFGSFFGVLGYSSFTFTKSKREKTIYSGINILGYGVILFLLTILLRGNFISEFILCALAPILHEIMLKYQAYFEIKNYPKYINSDEGIMILEVAPNSPAFEMGIKSGDTIVELNNTKIVTEEDVLNTLADVTNFIWLKVKNVQGKLIEVSYKEMNKTKKLGVVFVPKIIPKGSKIVKVESDSFDSVLEKVKKKQDEDDDEK